MLGNKGTRKFYRTGGTRGGQDHFKWDDVKADKDRENYLGHSLHAPVGRWQKGKDLLWYSRASGSSSSGGSNNGAATSKSAILEDPVLAEERRRLKEMDDDILNAALGIKKQRAFDPTDTSTLHRLDKDELKQLVARGATEQYRTEETLGKQSDAAANGSSEDATVAASTYAERIKGLGAAPAKFHEHIERISQLERQIERLRAGQKQHSDYDAVMHQLPGVSSIVRTTTNTAATAAVAMDSAESKYEPSPATAVVATTAVETVMGKRHRDGAEDSNSDDNSSDSDSNSDDKEHRKQRKLHKKEKKEKKREKKEKKRQKKERREREKSEQQQQQKSDGNVIAITNVAHNDDNIAPRRIDRSSDNNSRSSRYDQSERSSSNRRRSRSRSNSNSRSNRYNNNNSSSRSSRRY